MAGLCSLAAVPRAVTSSRSATKEPYATPKPASGTPRSFLQRGSSARGFPKSARVLRSSEFRKIYDTGVRSSGPLFAAFVLLRRPESKNAPESRSAPESKNAVQGARLGITVPRAFGDAVERNRTKRRLREAFRLHRDEIGNYDIVLNPRRAILKASFEDIQRALAKMMERFK